MLGLGFVSPVVGVGALLSQCRCPRHGRSPWGLSVIPSPRWWRHGGVRGAAVGGVNQRGRPRQGGGHDLHDPRPPGSGGCSRRRRSGAAVQARGCGGHAGRRTRARAARGRRRPHRCCGPGGRATRSRICPRRVCAGQRLHRLDRGPADQPGALLGDPPAVHGGVGLVVLRGQPGPGGQLLGRAKRVTSPISATNTAPSTGPIPGMAWIAR